MACTTTPRPVVLAYETHTPHEHAPHSPCLGMAGRRASWSYGSIIFLIPGVGILKHAPLTPPLNLFDHAPHTNALELHDSTGFRYIWLGSDADGIRATDTPLDQYTAAQWLYEMEHDSFFKAR